MPINGRTLSVNSSWTDIRGVFFIEVDLILWLFMTINLNEDFEVILTIRVKGDVRFDRARILNSYERGQFSLRGVIEGVCSSSQVESPVHNILIE